MGVIEITPRGTTAAIEDTSGDVEILNLTSVCMLHKAGYAWPKVGTWLAIKEPYLTLEEKNCDPCIRVTHPSDLMAAGTWPSGLLQRFGIAEEPTESTQRTPLQYKEAGNAALAENDFDDAHVNYTGGLRIRAECPKTFDQSIRYDLHRNRSRVRLLLGNYEGAITDALAALTHKSDDKHKILDGKALFRAATASYKLKMFEKAALYLRDQLQLSPNDKDAVALLKRVDHRIFEQEGGGYDLASIERSISLRQPSVDVADYLNRTVIKDTGSQRGRGLFATRALRPGDLILAETAFCCVWSHQEPNLLALACNARTPDETHPSLVGLWRTAVKEAAKNPTKGSALMELHGKYKGCGTRIAEVDGIAVIDTYQVQDIIQSNAWALHPLDLTDPEDLTSSLKRNAGIWIRMSYINHSCLPNAQKFFRGDLVFVHATKPIAEGEEIFFNYCDEYKDFEDRKKIMKFCWGFQCECRACRADAKCRPADLVERSRLRKDSSLYALAIPSTDKRNGNIPVLMERFVEEINKTYSNDLYADLPKTALIVAQNWMLEFYTTVDNRPKSRQATINLLRTLGFRVDTQGDVLRKISYTAHSIFPQNDTALIKPIARSALEICIPDDYSSAMHRLKFAQSLERVIQGTDTESVKMFQNYMKLPGVAARIPRVIENMEKIIQADQGL